MMRVAFIGSGGRLRDIYLPIIRATGRYRAVGFTTRSQKSAQRFESQTGIPSFQSAGELVLQAKPDFLIVAVPDRQNEATVSALLELGVPVLAETPLAWSVAGAKRLIAKAARRNLLIGVAEQFPFLPLERLRLRVIESGVLGEIQTVVNDFHTYSYHGVASLRQHVPGAPRIVRNVEQVSGTLRWESGSIRYDHGAELLHNWQVSGTPPRQSIRIEGTLGTMRDATIALKAGQTLTLERELTPAGRLAGVFVKLPGGQEIRWENPYAALSLSDEQVAVATVLDAMADAVQTGTAPAYTGTDFLADIQIVRALAFSRKRGGTNVTLPLNEGWERFRLLASPSALKEKFFR